MTGWEDIKYGYDFTTTPLAITQDSEGTYNIGFTILDSGTVGSIDDGPF
jgi:hypothetical protein